jgi:hypothetical protein
MWLIFVIEEHCEFINKAKIAFYVTAIFQAILPVERVRYFP